VYPAREEGGRWRAVWHEDGEQLQREARSENKLAAKVEKVAEWLAVGASNTKWPGADLIAWYLNPDRQPVDERGWRKHAHTSGGWASGSASRSLARSSARTSRAGRVHIGPPLTQGHRMPDRGQRNDRPGLAGRIAML
jgi:hypothetical protein